jgi:hypothetical protein
MSRTESFKEAADGAAGWFCECMGEPETHSFPKCQSILKRLRHIATSTFFNLCLYILHAILLVELFDTSASLACFLLAGVEWMALGTDLNVDFLLGGSCNESIATVTSHVCLIIIWMDSFSHDFTSSILIVIFNATLHMPVCPIRI